MRVLHTAVEQDRRTPEPESMHAEGRPPRGPSAKEKAIWKTHCKGTLILVPALPGGTRRAEGPCNSDTARTD